MVVSYGQLNWVQCIENIWVEVGVADNLRSLI